MSNMQFSLVAQSCPTLCNPMNRSTPGLPVHHHLPEFTQTHVHKEKNFHGANKVSEVAESCLTLCDPMDCSLPGSSVHGIFQARILEWLPFPSPEDLPDPGNEPRSPTL